MASRLQDVILRGTAAARPAATAVAPGTLYYSTDTSTTERCADTGLTWESYNDAGSAGAPTTASYIVETADAGLSAEVVLGTTVITTAADASKPSAAKAGRLFFPSDGVQVYRDTGSAWAPWGPLFPFTDPSLAAPTTWVNQGGASVSTTNGGLYLLAPATAGTNVRARVKTAPATPYTITAAVLTTLVGISTAPLAGLCFRQTSDGKLVTFHLGIDASGVGLYVSKWTSATVFSSAYASMPVVRSMGAGALAWLRITDNGTNRICSVSADGQNFLTCHSIGRTDFLTADQVGYFATPNGATFDTAITLLSWKET